MTLRSDANLVRNATQVDPPENDEERIGGLFQNIADIVETVDTIADLKELDTSNLSNGDEVWVKAYSTDGLSKRIGGGRFRWNTTPVCSVNNVGGYSDADHGFNDAFTMTVTALTRDLPCDAQYGANLRAANGAVIAVRTTESATLSGDDRIYNEGETSFIARFEAKAGIQDDGRNTSTGSVSDGENLYLLDDDGHIIRPTFTGFDGEGYWERILDDGYITPDHYGAIPNVHSTSGAVNDAHDELQACFDNIYYSSRVKQGFYYTSQNLKLRRSKQYLFDGYFMGFKQNRRRRSIFSSNVGAVYTDQDIDVITLSGAHVYDSRFNIDCTQVPDHRSGAFVVDMTYHDNSIRESYIRVRGNSDTFTNNIETGTRGFVVDSLNAVETTNEANIYGSSVGQFYGAKVYLDLEVVHTGVYFNAEPTDPNKSAFTNSHEFIFNEIRNFKRAVYMERGSDNSRYISKIWQLQFTIADPVPSDYPVLKILGSRCYTDGFFFDRNQTPNSDGLVTNATFIDFQQTDLRLGPITLGQFESTPGFFANTDQYLQTPFTNTYTQRITSSEILSSNTTPISITVPTYVGGQFILKSAHLIRTSGSTSYSTNTTMGLYGAFTNEGKFFEINIGDLGADNRAGYIPLDKQNLIFAQDDDLRLITDNGDPTGGDAEFDLVLEYIIP